MEMARDVRVERFRARLLNSAMFSITKGSDWEWRVESDVCRIDFVYERYSEHTFNILVSDPRTTAPSASFLALRFLRGARDVLPEASPENFAEIFNTYFSDVLAGEFSILAEYDKLGNAFWVLFMDAMDLEEDDPVRIKMTAWDIGWLDDMKKRQSE